MELEKRGLAVVRQQAFLRSSQDGVLFETALRADSIVADSVIVEIKRVREINPVDRRQLVFDWRLQRRFHPPHLNLSDMTLAANSEIDLRPNLNDLTRRQPEERIRRQSIAR